MTTTTINKKSKKTAKTARKTATKTTTRASTPPATLTEEQKEYLLIRRSSIHNRGIFARTLIPKGKQVIEYVGERITKAESDRRSDATLDKAKRQKSRGAVYIVIVNKRHDIDGDVPWNLARYVNHSCDPNCELLNIRGRIWIVAIRDIQPGEELSYNYGFDYAMHAEEPHPCRCGSPKCIGFILHRRHWWRLRKARENGKGLLS